MPYDFRLMVRIAEHECTTRPQPLNQDCGVLRSRPQKHVLRPRPTLKTIQQGCSLKNKWGMLLRSLKCLLKQCKRTLLKCLHVFHFALKLLCVQDTMKLLYNQLKIIVVLPDTEATVE